MKYSVFDDRPDSVSDRPVGSDASGDRRRLAAYVREYGPIAPVSLQADLFPYDPRRFERLLASLLREGSVEIRNRHVVAGVDPTELGDPVEVSLPETTLTLRPAFGGDFPALLALVRSVERCGDHTGIGAVRREIVSEGRIHRRDESRWRIVYVADVDGRLAGWAHLTAPGDRLTPVTLTGAVGKEFRGVGVGSHLLNYALDRARTHGCREVVQHIPAHDDDAYQFLRMHGWRVDGTRTDSRDAPNSVDELKVVQEL